MNLTTVIHPAYGDGAATFASSMEDYMSNEETQSQGIQDRLETTNNVLFGTGILADSYTAPLLTAGTGLAVNIAAHTSLIGFGRIKVAASEGGLAPSNTNYIYLKQDGSFDSNTTGVNPGTTQNPAILLGTAITNTTNVTSVTELFDIIYPPLSNNPQTSETFGAVADHIKTWDADFDTRTGGDTDVYTLTVDNAIDDTKTLMLLRGNGEDVVMSPATYTRDGDSDIVIPDNGKRAVDNGSDIRENYTVIYTPL